MVVHSLVVLIGFCLVEIDFLGVGANGCSVSRVVPFVALENIVGLLLLEVKVLSLFGFLVDLGVHSLVVWTTTEI